LFTVSPCILWTSCRDKCTVRIVARTSKAHATTKFLLLIIKLLLRKLRRHMGQWRLSSNHSQTHYQMKLRSRLHAPAVLPRQPLDWRQGWPQKRYKRTKSSEGLLRLPGNERLLGHTASNLITTPNALS
jgi:hypothetical protein